MNRNYELNLIWDYKPKRSTGDHYFFEGPYKRSLLVNGVIKEYEIELALLGVMNAAESFNGIHQVQELTHKTSGRVLWIVDGLSLEKVDFILENSARPLHDILRNSATMITFPEELRKDLE